jgi:hypothetical protein
MVGISVTIEFDDMPMPEVDEEAIGRWIEGRLNAARNLFIRNVSRGGGTGRTYRRGRRGVHQASAPGEYPVTDSGRLVNSIDYEMNGPLRGTLFSTVEYARFLRDGTTGIREMKPRKMLDEALEEALATGPPIPGGGVRFR